MLRGMRFRRVHIVGFPGGVHWEAVFGRRAKGHGRNVDRR